MQQYLENPVPLLVAFVAGVLSTLFFSGFGSATEEPKSSVARAPTPKPPQVPAPPAIQKPAGQPSGIPVVAAAKPVTAAAPPPPVKVVEKPKVVAPPPATSPTEGNPVVAPAAPKVVSASLCSIRLSPFRFSLFPSHPFTTHTRHQPLGRPQTRQSEQTRQP